MITKNFNCMLEVNDCFVTVRQTKTKTCHQQIQTRRCRKRQLRVDKADNTKAKRKKTRM